jgi:hypothetical protein
MTTFGWSWTILESSAETQRHKDTEKNKRNVFTLCLCVLYVQNTAKTFYYRSSCSRGDERSEESCEHDDWPTTDCGSVLVDRHRAWSKPVSCPFARTAD